MQATRMIDAAALRARFPVLGRRVHDRPLVYLDNAATTLKPDVVIDAVASHYREETANIHRGVHYLSEQATAHYEGAREKIRHFLNAADPAEVIFTSGTTDSINLVALGHGRQQLQAGDEILVSHMEHHSNIVPWQLLCRQLGCRLRVIPINDAGELDMAAFHQLLSERTRLVAVTYVANSLGTITPIGEIISAAHAHGALALVDAAQAVAHLPLDVRALDCDFLAFSGHKLYGPTGTGVLYGKRWLLEQMEPVKGGGDMIRSVSFEESTWADLPNKLEAGTPHIAGVIGLGAAIDFVEELGRPAIQQWEEQLLGEATAKLRAVPGLRIIGTAAQKASVISFVVDGIHPHDLGTLVDRRGVAIRTGHHCAQPVMERFGVPATARASLAVYNIASEVDTLVAAIRDAQELFS